VRGTRELRKSSHLDLARLTCANLAVPDRAMVPREESRSSLVMPMPLSSMVIVRAALSV